LASALAAASIAAEIVGLIRRTIPTIKGLDLLPPCLVAIGAPIALRHWYLPKSAAEIYGTIAATWDNTSHYYLVNVMHVSQTMTRRMPLPADGSENGFLSYPVGYHSWTASLLDLMAGPQTLSPDQQAAGFLHVTALVVAIIFLLVGCAIAAIPAIRDRGIGGYFAISLAMSLVIFGPAFWPVVDGHYNFQFAITMAFVAFAVCLQGKGLFAVTSSSALLAAVLCAGGAWLPMGALAAAAAVGIFWPLNRANFLASRSARIWVLLASAVVSMATAIPASWASGEFEGGVFTSATGGVTATPAILLVLTMLGLVIVAVVSNPEPDSISRLRAKATSIVMLVVLVVFVIWQTISMQTIGLSALNYYPQKLLNGIGLVACLIAIVSLAVMLLPAKPGGQQTSATIQRESLRLSLVCAAGFICFWLMLLPAFAQGGVPGSVIEKKNLAESRPDLVRACQAAHQLPPDVVGLVVGPNPTDTLTCAADRGLYTHLAWRLNADIMNKWDEAVVTAVRDDLIAGRAVLIVDPFVVENYRAFAGESLVDRVIAW